MALLKTLGHGQGYIKAGFQGFQGSGKTYTATLLAIGVRESFKISGPIAFVDTENATEYIAPLVRELTGKELVGDRTRDFEKLLALGKECVEAGISCLVVDSMTHFWRSLCDAYLRGVNEGRKKWNKPPRQKLEFQDWGNIKTEWARWTDFYLNSPLHVIICGRAGYEYDMEKNEDTGRTELIKTGTKMKTEAEFGFEPSLLVEMDIEQQPNPKEAGRFIQVRTGQVLKDRFAVIDGDRLVFAKCKTKREELAAVMSAFGPHVNMLKPGSHSTVQTKGEAMPVDEHGDAEWAKERKVREIIAEEIKGVLITAQLDGTSSDAKTRRMELLSSIFGTRSWSAVETMDSGVLRVGLAKLKDAVGLNERLATDAPTATAPTAAVEEDDLPFPVAATPKPAPVQAPAAKPAPAPRPTPPAVDEFEPELSAELQQLMALLKGHVPAALSWLRSRGWLTEEQGLPDLPPNRIAQILSKPTVFLRTISTQLQPA